MEAQDLNRKIIAGVVDRNGRDLGPQEKARVEDMARTLWRGDKGVGTAVREAMDIVKSER